MGKIEIKKVFIEELGRERYLRIYLPEDYYTSGKKYPVIYMHDAQNLYDPKSSSYGAIWDVQGAVTGLGDFAIVVGIDHGKEHRFDEYSPWVNSKLLLTMNRFKDLEGHLGGQGSMYGSYIVNTLKPFIDRTYRTLTGVDNTAIIGSSMGAYISLYIGIEYLMCLEKLVHSQRRLGLTKKHCLST